MRIEVRPALSDAEQAVLLRGLNAAGVRVGTGFDAQTALWQRAAAREAVDRQPSPARYACSPRSTRGATRA